MEEERRKIQVPPHKQLVMDIGKTKYTVNLHFKQGTGETYKDKILKLSLIHISEPTRLHKVSRMPSSA